MRFFVSPGSFSMTTTEPLVALAEASW